jgi:hypothetical protein
MERLESEIVRRCDWCGTEYEKPYNMTVERFWLKEVAFCSYNCAHMYKKVDHAGVLGRILVEHGITVKELHGWIEGICTGALYRFSIHGVPVQLDGRDGFDIVKEIDGVLGNMGIVGGWDKRFWLVENGLGFPDTNERYKSSVEADKRAGGRYDYRMLLIN